jgi:hypothetical protein
MPQKNNHTATTSRTRKNISKRIKQCNVGCKEGIGPKADIKQTIANSIFAVKLHPIPGIVVEQKVLSTTSSTNKVELEYDYDKMYVDLFGAYQNALHIKGEKSPFNPLKSGMTLSLSINYLVNAFKNNIVPEGFHVNIDRSVDGDYCFVIWKDLGFREFWHFFTIKPVLEFLNKKNKKLENIFTNAIKGLIERSGFTAWFHGNLYPFDSLVYDEMFMQDYIENSTDNTEEYEADILKMQELKHEYENGNAKKYETIIKKYSNSDIDILIKDLSKYPKTNKVANWIRMVVDLLKEGQCINNFIYEAGIEEYNDEPILKLYDMFTIIWDEDLIFDIACEYIDNEAMNGIEIPIINYWVNKNTKSIPFKKLIDGQGWIKKLADLFYAYQDLLKTINYEHAHL